jgi:hypothetical protein
MKPSAQSINEISCQQSWRQEEDSQEDGEQLQNLQSSTSSSSTMIRTMTLQNLQSSTSSYSRMIRTTTIDIINQALKILEEDDDESTMITFFGPSKPDYQGASSGDSAD